MSSSARLNVGEATAAAVTAAAATTGGGEGGGTWPIGVMPRATSAVGVPNRPCRSSMKRSAEASPLSASLPFNAPAA